MIGSGTPWHEMDSVRTRFWVWIVFAAVVSLSLIINIYWFLRPRPRKGSGVTPLKVPPINNQVNIDSVTPVPNVIQNETKWPVFVQKFMSLSVTVRVALVIEILMVLAAVTAILVILSLPHNTEDSDLFDDEPLEQVEQEEPMEEHWWEMPEIPDWVIGIFATVVCVGLVILYVTRQQTPPGDIPTTDTRRVPTNPSRATTTISDPSRATTDPSRTTTTTTDPSRVVATTATTTDPTSVTVDPSRVTITTTPDPTRVTTTTTTTTDATRVTTTTATTPALTPGTEPAHSIPDTEVTEYTKERIEKRTGLAGLPMSYQQPKAFQRPAGLPKGAYCPLGLVNYGNTCFMNAVLQCLAHLNIDTRLTGDHSEGSGVEATLKYTLMAIRGQPTPLFTPRPGHPTNVGPSDMVHYLKAVFEMEVVDAKLASTEYNFGQQQDASEFLIKLAEASEGLAMQIGPLTLTLQYKCSVCHAKHSKVDKYSLMPVALEGPAKKPNLSDIILKDDPLTEVTCSACNRKLAEVVRTQRPLATPNILVVLLKRFNALLERIGKPVKCEREIKFGDKRYRLRAAVLHEGGDSLVHGHYEALLLMDSLPHGQVLRVSDENMQVVDDRILDHSFILFYESITLTKA